MISQKDELELGKNEWSIRVCDKLLPVIKDHIQEIFESTKMIAMETRQMKDYLKSFMQALKGIKTWNASTIEEVRKKTLAAVQCPCFEDMLTATFIAQIKVLSTVRCNPKPRKIDIQFPSIDLFIHKVYTDCAGCIYYHAYLYNINDTPLQRMKNSANISQLLTETIKKTIRDFIPIEQLLRSYLENSKESFEEVTEIREVIAEDPPLPPAPLAVETTNQPYIPTSQQPTFYSPDPPAPSQIQQPPLYAPVPQPQPQLVPTPSLVAAPAPALVAAPASALGIDSLLSLNDVLDVSTDMF